MSAPEEQLQFPRKAQLVVESQTEDFDLSNMRFKFEVRQSDVETPNNASIRVYNLADETVNKIMSKTPVEFTKVTLQAGYESSYGTLFVGTIKQFRRGRENNIDSYFDILAADSDVAYNFTFINNSLPKGTTSADDVKAIVDAMAIKAGFLTPGLGGTFPRGRSKILFGLNRVLMRQAAESVGGSWSIQNGELQVIELTGFLPDVAIDLNSQSGMIGQPEQTDQGVKIRCLLNPKIKIGGRVHINNKDINITTARGRNALPVGQIPFNQWTAIQYFADISADGFYRVFIAEHIGDTRGHEWYTDLICLFVDPSSETVPAFG